MLNENGDKQSKNTHVEVNLFFINSPYFFYSRSTLKSLVVLFPLLGVTWLFGLLVFATQNVVFQYLFSLFNTMQV